MIELFESESSRALALIETVHGSDVPLAPEYPLVFGAGVEGHTLALGEAGEIHSACALLTRELALPARSGKSRLEVGLIGSVATGAAWRGRGLGTRLIVEAEARLQIQGCAAVFLWADDPSFYLHRGYAPAGCEEDVIIPALIAPRLPAPRGVRPLQAADVPAVHALYSKHTARVVRTQEETAALICCPKMDALVRERGGEVVAYALRGRGRDLSEVVHEWGGAPADILSLLRAHLERRFASCDPGALFLMSPPSETALLAALDEFGCERSTGILGLCKLLDRDAAAAAIAQRLGPEGSAKAASAVDTEGRRIDGIHLQGPSGECLLDDEGAVALLFAASSVQESVRELIRNLGLEDAQLPLEPFFWGLDSI